MLQSVTAPEEEAEEEEEEGVTAAPKPEKVELSGKAIEAKSAFTCKKCGQGYVVLYDSEKRAIQVMVVKEAKGKEFYERLTAAPKLYKIELKVDLPGRWVGEIDAETGEYRFKRAEA